MNQQAKNTLALGIDIGSTTAKVVLVDNGKVLYEKYQRHFSQVRQKTLELLAEAAPLAGDRPLTAAISGSAGLGLAQGAKVPFVQEVFARLLRRRHWCVHRPDGHTAECDGR